MEAASKLASYADRDWHGISNLNDGELARLTAEILECVRVVKAVAERVVELNDTRQEFRKSQNDTLRNLISTASDYQSR
jgi:hypothetical protein